MYNIPNAVKVHFYALHNKPTTELCIRSLSEMEIL